MRRYEGVPVAMEQKVTLSGELLIGLAEAAQLASRDWLG